LTTTGIILYWILATRENTPFIEKVTITNMPDNERQFFVRIDGGNFVFDTVKVKVIGLDCSIENPCEVPNNVLKKMSVIKESSLENVPLTLPSGEFQILTQNGGSKMSNSITLTVP
jgi:hypothetical protein